MEKYVFWRFRVQLLDLLALTCLKHHVNKSDISQQTNLRDISEELQIFPVQRIQSTCFTTKIHPLSDDCGTVSHVCLEKQHILHHTHMYKDTIMYAQRTNRRNMMKHVFYNEK